MKSDINFILSSRSEYMATHDAPSRVYIPKKMWERISEMFMNESWAPSNLPNEELMGMKVIPISSENEEHVRFE